MFEIKVSDTDVTGGTIPVSCCLDIETLKKLSDKDIKNPQVVVITAPVKNYSINKEYRKVFPLKDLIGYVEFRSSGENKIWAFITELNNKSSKNQYLAKSGGVYITDLINSDNTGWSYLFCDWSKPDILPLPKFGAEPLTVNVPEGVFAPEPSAFEKIWVNYFFRDKAIDQCEFRRRRFVAYSLQPLLMLGQIVLRALFLLVALLWGAKNISYKPLLHPLRYNTIEAIDVCSGGSIFFDKWWKIPFMPLILIMITLICLSGAAHIIFPVIAGAALLSGFITLMIMGKYEDVIKWFNKVMNKVMNEDPNKSPWYVDQDEIDLLTCSNEKKPFTFNSLPAKKKTLGLRINDIKSRICRPFSA